MSEHAAASLTTPAAYSRSSPKGVKLRIMVQQASSDWAAPDSWTDGTRSSAVPSGQNCASSDRTCADCTSRSSRSPTHLQVRVPTTITSREYRSLQRRFERQREPSTRSGSNVTSYVVSSRTVSGDVNTIMTRLAAGLAQEAKPFNTFRRLYIELIRATDPTPAAERTGGEPPGYPSERVARFISYLRQVELRLEDLSAGIESVLGIPENETHHRHCPPQLSARLTPARIRPRPRCRDPLLYRPTPPRHHGRPRQSRRHNRASCQNHPQPTRSVRSARGRVRRRFEDISISTAALSAMTTASHLLISSLEPLPCCCLPRRPTLRRPEFPRRDLRE